MRNRLLSQRTFLLLSRDYKQKKSEKFFENKARTLAFFDIIVLYYIYIK